MPGRWQQQCSLLISALQQLVMLRIAILPHHLVLDVGDVTLEFLNPTSQFLHLGFVLFGTAACMIELCTAILQRLLQLDVRVTRLRQLLFVTHAATVIL